MLDIKGILSDGEGISALATRARKGPLEIAWTSDVQPNQRQSQRLPQLQIRLASAHLRWIRWVPENADPRGFRGHLLEELQSLSEDLQTRLMRQPRQIAAGPREARDESSSDGISCSHHHDGDSGGRVLGRERSRVRASEDEIHPLPDELRGQIGEAHRLAVRKPALDGEVFSLDPAQLAQPLPEGCEIGHVGLSRKGR